MRFFSFGSDHMTFHLTKAVVCGELYNTSNYTVHGWVGLQGYDRPLMLQLTGNPKADLAGRGIRFEARNALLLDPNDAPLDLSDLAWQQVGPTGTMTTTSDVAGSNSLHLEWSGQNGRIVIELPDPIIHFLDHDDEDDDEDDADWGVDDDRQLSDALIDMDDPFSSPELNSPSEFEDADSEFSFNDEEDEEDEDPYGLLPPELHAQFEQEAWDTDRAIDPEGSSSAPDTNDSDDGDITVRELRLMDELIERGEGDLIRTIFDEPIRLPRPNKVSADEVEPLLKLLLAQLAQFGIALDVCEHFSPHDSYRLLIDEICPRQRAYPELRNTQWVQHFMTCDYCPECNAETEREFSEQESHREDEE